MAKKGKSRGDRWRDVCDLDLDVDLDVVDEAANIDLPLGFGRD